MKSKVPKTKASEKADTEHKSEEPTAQWKERFRGAWHDFSPKYFSNLVFLIVGILVAPTIGVLMHSQKSIVYGAAAGITIVIWLFAYHVAQQKDEATQPKIPLPFVETELHGLLIPANDPTPQSKCFVEMKDRITPDALLLFFGNSLAYTRKAKIVAIKVAGRDLISIRKTSEGIGISAQVFSADGRIVAELEDNVFHVNPNNYFKIKRADKSTLIVYDQQNNHVINVRYLNPSTIKILGIFHSPNRAPVVIEEEKQTIPGAGTFVEGCFGDAPVGILIK